MANFQLSIEGKDAADAAKAFFEDIPELSGTWEPVEEDRKDVGIVDIIVNVVGVTGVSVVFLAQKIFEWCEKCKHDKASDKAYGKSSSAGKTGAGRKVEKVVIVCADGTRRLMMMDASIEDIQRFLENC